MLLRLIGHYNCVKWIHTPCKNAEAHLLVIFFLPSSREEVTWSQPAAMRVRESSIGTGFTQDYAGGALQLNATNETPVCFHVL